jgi:hypothetical protein
MFLKVMMGVRMSKNKKLTKKWVLKNEPENLFAYELAKLTKRYIRKGYSLKNIVSDNYNIGINSM